MNACILCLVNNCSAVNSININSTQWQTHNVKYLIEKHLWPMADIGLSVCMCNNCWMELNGFNKFYERIKEAHSNLNLIVVKNEIFLEQPLPNDFVIKNETECIEMEQDTARLQEKCENPLNITDSLNKGIPTDANVSEIKVVNENDILCINNEQDQVTESFEENCENPLNITDPLNKSIPTETNNLKNVKAIIEKDIVCINNEQYQVTESLQEKCENSPNIKENSNKEKPNKTRNIKKPNKKISKLLNNKHRKSKLKTKISESSTKKKLSKTKNLVVNKNSDKLLIPKKPETVLVESLKCLEIEKDVVNDNSQKSIELQMLKSSNCKENDTANCIETDENVEASNDSQLVEMPRKTRRFPEDKNDEECDKFISENFKIVCSICQTSQERFYDLCRHIRDKHNNKRGYVICCNKKIKSRPLLIDHIHTHLDPNYFKCHQCDKVFTLRSTLEIHAKIHERDENGYICKKCGRTFVEQKRFDRHQRTHELGYKKLSCPECGKLFIASSYLKIHMKGVHQIFDTKKLESLSCTEFDENLETSDQKKSERKRSRKNPNIKSDEECDKFISENFQIACCICQTSQKNFYSLCKHFRDEHNNKRGYVICCKKKITTRPLLFDHIHTHLDPNYFKCHQCDKVFTLRSTLELHAKIHERDENGYNCDKCGKTFVEQKKLEKHKRTHEPGYEKFSCPECGKLFTTSRYLRNHIDGVHKKKYDNICEICGKVMRSGDPFKIHMESHKNKESIAVNCDICGIRFTNITGLRRHKNVQHPVGGKKDYHCHLCPKVTPNAVALTTHIRINHRAVPKYKCKTCGKQCKTLKNLKEHMTRHTGTPIYFCDWCPKTFMTHGNFSFHRKKSHPKEWEAICQHRSLNNLPQNSSVTVSEICEPVD